MKNNTIQFMSNVLSGLQLDIKESSARRRFLRLLKGAMEDYDIELADLRKRYSEKDEKGQMKVIDNQIQFTKENRKLFGTEYDKLMDLEVPIDFASNEQDREIIKTILTRRKDEFASEQKEKFTDVEYDYMEKMDEAIAALN